LIGAVLISNVIKTQNIFGCLDEQLLQYYETKPIYLREAYFILFNFFLLKPVICVLFGVSG
jgi:hypothetical protein